ncbi:hypothetical protein E5198_17240 [Pseudomonas sp. A-1]|jgi:hypothetical protein|uniref:hypothetical protein n=1 Tax=Pseudomonas sp. A-1 TaxID=1821274 RepID=UPI0010A5EFCC|nr:hypothetical protein [Pseudomonas sp. A-1]THG72198.1 hypothetical protein E5198_19865 [Pseudomonas sp. A-1]THG77026.1 hypothetical protein E5198_17240 [Pseudomonas sp. A-1]
MPKLSQGDIFESIEKSRDSLAVVFGHIGFNLMSQYWKAFSARHPQVEMIRSPFNGLPNIPVQLSNNRWLWFIQGETNHGMTDERLLSNLEMAFSWASRQHIRFVVTNGIADTDHDKDTAHNRQSDERRARFLVDYARGVEEKHDIRIELVSLNDIFVRS